MEGDEIGCAGGVCAGDLFVSGQGGYKIYRIPALAVTTRGTILAFCEARKFTGEDSDQIDLFLRRSFDCGGLRPSRWWPRSRLGLRQPRAVVDRDTA